MTHFKVSKKFYAEPVDPAALRYIIDHVLPDMNLKKRDENLPVRLRKMLASVNENSKTLRVSYAKKIKDASGKEYGRDYSKLPLSFQNLNRTIRNALVNHYMATTGKRCQDIDVVNCHPVLFLQLLQKHSVQFEHPLVARYVNEREAILDDVKDAYDVDRDTAKALLLALINFGTVRGWAYRYEVVIPPGAANSKVAQFLEGYQSQFRGCVSELMEKLPVLAEAAKQSLDADASEGPYSCAEELKLHKRFVHILLTDAESRVLDATMDYIVRKHKQAVIIAKMYDGCIVACEDDIDCSAIRSHVSERTEFYLNFEVKPFATPVTIPTDLPPDEDEASDGELLDDMILAGKIVDMIGDKVIRSGDSYYGYNNATNLWNSGSINDIVPQMLVHEENLVFTGTCPAKGKEVTKNLGCSGHMKAAVSYVPPYIPLNNEFLVSKHNSTYRKIKFRDGVYDMLSGSFRPSFEPSEYFMVDVPRRFPSRDQAAVDKAVDLLKGIYTPAREDPKPFDPTFGPEMSLWQFVITAIGLAIAGEVEWKYAFAMIGERNSGKGVTQAALTAAFGSGLISSGFSANNLLGNDTSVDEAKKFMFLRDPAVSGCRIVWPNEIRTTTQKGETFIDGNLIKGIASGGDTLLVRGNHQDPFSVRPEFTMFLNVNDLPVTKPAIGNSMLRIIHPNVYIKNPSKPNHKLADPAIKHLVHDEGFANGMMWAVADVYRLFKGTGKAFEPILQVMNATDDANEDEEEDVLAVLRSAIDFAEPFQSEEFYKERGYVMRALHLKTVVNNLKREGKLKGCSLSGVSTKLHNHGYEKKRMRVAGENTQFFLGMRLQEAEGSHGDGGVPMEG